MLEGEDERSVERNTAAIIAECKKRHPDKSILADKLKRTVAYRQKLCIEKTTCEVLQSFPTLQQHLFVS